MGKKRRAKKIARPEVVRQFAERLREVRRNAGLTQRELAEKAHLSEGYVVRLEGGDTSPGLDLMSRLAAALSVSLTDLLPASAPPAPLDALRGRARSLCEEVVSAGDRVTLNLVVSFLARLLGR
jgi:transcriptional regulator with XRE-family HTH domain